MEKEEGRKEERDRTFCFGSSLCSKVNNEAIQDVDGSRFFALAWRFASRSLKEHPKLLRRKRKAVFRVFELVGTHMNLLIFIDHITNINKFARQTSDAFFPTRHPSSPASPPPFSPPTLTPRPSLTLLSPSPTHLSKNFGLIHVFRTH